VIGAEDRQHLRVRGERNAARAPGVARQRRPFAHPRGELLLERGIGGLQAIRLLDQRHERGALRLRLDQMQPRPLFGGEHPQLGEHRRGNRPRRERAAMGAAVRDRRELRALLGGRFGGRAEAEAGEEVGIGGVRPEHHLAGVPEAAQGEAEMEEGGAAGEQELAVVGVAHRQRAAPVGPQLDPLAGEPKTPRLDVVHRGGEHRVAGEEAEPLGGGAAGRVVVFGDRPELFAGSVVHRALRRGSGGPGEHTARPAPRWPVPRDALSLCVRTAGA